MQDYPEGPGVLLELVQNADDAGAHKAAFLLDARQYGTSSLLGPGMAAWQGPGMYRLSPVSEPCSSWRN